MSDGVPRNALPTWEDLADGDRPGCGRIDAGCHSRCGWNRVHGSVVRGRASASCRRPRPREHICELPGGRRLPIGVSPEDIDAIAAMVQAGWGTPELVLRAMPSRADDHASARAARLAGML